ncbi:maleylpyruvate isomerase family mycothiol-dependent enzyme [Rhodococcus sp. X156]|uniref:maleylpyruvate isomerase family mycothiol-dependent enzyme n=1 Tax=Rhodococcus sp. X156 TaxID=2499145 RepID=UPI000FDB1C61|nr:maleylpyruvate isomerase family mycothiol-dependent enzyme [Rhodococcus sp. X156]
MAADEQVLASYIQAWRSSADDVLELLRSLDADDWSRPTDLAGWDVHAVAAHLAHIEAELAGVPQPRVDVPDLPHLTGKMSRYTESGCIARVDWTPGQIIDELDSSVQARAKSLAANPPSDAASPAAVTPGGTPWSWEVLLSNRVVDMWMHEQDIRRAVGRPGHLDTAGAAHCVGVFSRALPVVVGKRVAPPAGTVVALEVSGPHGFTAAVEVGEDGRARTPQQPPSSPTVSLAMDTETFTMLGGGRRSPDAMSDRLTIGGDQTLVLQVLTALAVTP